MCERIQSYRDTDLSYYTFRAQTCAYKSQVDPLCNFLLVSASYDIYSQTRQSSSGVFLATNPLGEWAIVPIPHEGLLILLFLLYYTEPNITEDHHVAGACNKDTVSCENPPPPLPEDTARRGSPLRHLFFCFSTRREGYALPAVCISASLPAVY